MRIGRQWHRRIDRQTVHPSASRIISREEYLIANLIIRQTGLQAAMRTVRPHLFRRPGRIVLTAGRMKTRGLMKIDQAR